MNKTTEYLIMRKISEYLSKFCEKSSPVTRFQAPFIAGGKLMASNGKVLIKCLGPNPNPECFATEENPDAIDRVITRIESAEYATGIIIGPPDVPAKVQCGKCLGIGSYSQRTCEECSGQRSVEFENDHHSYSVECQSCCGKGTEALGEKEECQPCGGSGKIDADDSKVCISGLYFPTKQIALIRDKPNLDLSIDEKLNCLYFRFPNFDGCIMGIYQPEQPATAENGEESCTKI